jgi:hypothetical protein
MKIGLWVLSAAAVVGAGTLLAAALPVPPVGSSMQAARAPATATQLAAAADATTQADRAQPPAASSPQPAATPHMVPTAVPPPAAAVHPKRDTASVTPPSTPSAPAAVHPRRATAVVMPSAPGALRPKRTTATAAAEHRAAPKHLAQSPSRHLAEAALDRDRRAGAHPADLHYGAIVPKPPSSYPATPAREPTHLAMVPPPPYDMPPPYWRPSYRPYPPYSPN